MVFLALWSGLAVTTTTELKDTLLAFTRVTLVQPCKISTFDITFHFINGEGQDSVFCQE